MPEVSPAKKKTPESDSNSDGNSSVSETVDESSQDERGYVNVDFAQGEPKDKFHIAWIKIYPLLEFNDGEISQRLLITKLLLSYF